MHYGRHKTHPHISVNGFPAGAPAAARRGSRLLGRGHLKRADAVGLVRAVVAAQDQFLVIRHGAGRRLAVVGADRRVDGAVLFEQDAVVLRPRAQGIAMIGEHLLQDLAEDGHQVHVDRAAGRLGDGQVELEVVVGLEPLRPAGPAHDLQTALDLGDLLVGAPPRGAARGPDLDPSADGGQVVQVVPVDAQQLGQGRIAPVRRRDDACAAALDRGDESLGLELLQRGAHGDAADVHHLGQLTLARQALARRQLAGGDQAKQLLGDPVGHPFARDLLEPGIEIGFRHGVLVLHGVRSRCHRRNWPIGNTTFRHLTAPGPVPSRRAPRWRGPGWKGPWRRGPGRAAVFYTGGSGYSPVVALPRTDVPCREGRA